LRFPITIWRTVLELRWNGLAFISNRWKGIVGLHKSREFQYGDSGDAKLLFNAAVTSRNYARRRIYPILEYPVKITVFKRADCTSIHKTGKVE
jgi:hypothetical protein